VIETAGLTVRVNGLVAVLLPLSCTWTVKVALVAEAPRVPEMAPALLRDRPVGSEPALRDQVYPVPVPPAAERVAPA
jgi:hypothetical protein